MQRILNPMSVPKDVGSLCVKKGNKKKVSKRNSNKSSLTDHVQKYDLLCELANASSGLSIGQLLRGDKIQARKDPSRLFARKTPSKVAVLSTGRETNQGRRVLKTTLAKRYGTEAHALLDSDAIPNVISNKFVTKLELDVEKTTRRITVATGVKLQVVAILQDVPAWFDTMKVKLNFLVVEGLPYDVIIGDPTMEELKAVLDLANRVATFDIDGDAVQLPLHPDYINCPVNEKEGTDSEDFTSASSAVPSLESSSDESETGKEDNGDEFLLTLGEHLDNYSSPPTPELTKDCVEIRDHINLKLSHLSSDEAARVEEVLYGSDVFAK